MKSLIKKELRENLRVAVLGLAVLALFLVLFCRAYNRSMADVAAGMSSAFEGVLQPLLRGESHGWLAFLFSSFGALLGWFQIHNEGGRDLWAFLLHRPLTRSQLFLGKVIAGLTLYVAATCPPLFAFVAWVCIPGHVAAPFEWGMVLPILSVWLGGMVFYFAGMLTGLRQARWYVSRAVGLITAVLVVLSARIVPSFSHALVLLLAGIAVLGVAAWGSFLTTGFYEGQPATARPALAVSLGVGIASVLFLAVVFVVRVLTGPESFPTAARYVMTKDGSLYKIVPTAGGATQVENLDGKPAVDAATGRRVEPSEIDGRASTTVTSHSQFYNGAEGWGIYARSEHYFLLWRGSRQTLWYYSRRYGRLVAYDVASRKQTGFLGPEGFSASGPGSGEPFLYPNEASPWILRSAPFLCTSKAVYQPDLEHGSVVPIFKVQEGDRILTANQLTSANSEWICSLIFSQKAFHLLTPQGKLITEIPAGASEGKQGYFQISTLEPAGQCAVWIFPSSWASRRADWKLPVRVIWMSRDGGVLKTAEVPMLREQEPKVEFRNRVVFAAAPPGFFAAMPFLSGEPWGMAFERMWKQSWLPSSLMAALVALPIGWWMGMRHRLSPAALLGWTLFNLVFGIGGLLTFVCVQEWPAQESCPKCGKMRSVDRGECEHCGAGFAAPEKNGTEIFEVVGAE